MGREVKLFELSNGKEYSISEIMLKTGCKNSAIRYRLSKTRDAAKILAPKGTHQDYGYGRRRVLKKPPKIAKINNQAQEIMEKYIINNKPFYDKYFRLALKKISCIKRGGIK
jgi:hypothetical protein